MQSCSALCWTGLRIICDCDLALFLRGRVTLFNTNSLPKKFHLVNCNFYCPGFNKLQSKVSVPFSASLPISDEILNLNNISPGLILSPKFPCKNHIHKRPHASSLLTSAFLLKFLCSTLLTTTCLQMHQQLLLLKNGLVSLMGAMISGICMPPTVSLVLKQFSAHLLAWTLLTSPLKSSLKKKKYPFPRYFSVILNFTLNLPVKCLPLWMERQSVLKQSHCLRQDLISSHIRADRERDDPLRQ